MVERDAPMASPAPWETNTNYPRASYFTMKSQNIDSKAKIG